ncbi:MAG: lipid-A-disaccharide synthase [Akkermansiaceae bacterium]
MTSRTVYVVAGEVSGDTHGSELMDALGKQAGGFSFRGLGGPEMSRLSEGLVRNWVEDAAVVGVWEVLRRYGWFKKRFEETLSEILELRPAVLLLIDYPGFNLRLAKQIHEKLPATKIVHYVAPQVWAWNQKRIPQIATTHDLMICLFPFEVPLFEEAGLRSRCLGHPLVDELEEKRIKVGRRENLIGLFPGSRIKEVCRLFPMMLESASRLLKENPEIRFVAAAASEKVARVMGNFLEASGLPDNLVEVQTGESQYLMQTVTCGVVASGTATLEAAYYGMSYCLVYRVAWPTFLMAKQLVKLKFIGLINILAGRELVREFIQTEANAYEVAFWLGQALANEGERAKLSGELLEAASRLGEPGVHERAAHEIALLFTE